MSKLVGYKNSDLSTIDFDRVRTALANDVSINESAPIFVESSWLVAGLTSFKHMSCTTHFAEDKASGITVALVGRVDNREEFNSNPMCSNSQLLLDLFEQYGSSALARLKGDFSGFIFNSQIDELILFRDKIGVVPMYYTTYDKAVIFATDIKSIVCLTDHDLLPEPQGLSDYIDGGDLSLRDDLTCFKNIYSVLPAHVVSIRGGILKTYKYWDFNFHRNETPQSFGEATAQFRILFEQAVARRMRYSKSPSISVSGGLDSSAIYCQAMKINSNTKGYSYVSNLIASDESKFLSELENKYSKEIGRIQITDKVRVTDSIYEQVKIAEAPFVDYLWSITSQFESHLVRNNSEVMMSGHWGDQIFFDWAYLIDDAQNFNFRRIYKHLREFNNWYQENVRDYIRNQIARELLKALLPQWAIVTYKKIKTIYFQRRSKHLELRAIQLGKSVQHPSKPNLRPQNKKNVSKQSISIYNQVRSRYHVHCLEWNFKTANHFGLEFSFPILDVDLLEFMIMLPGHLQNYQGVPRAILREGLRGVLPDAIADRTWKADFSDFVHNAIRDEIALICEKLDHDSNCVKSNLIDGEKMAQLINQAREIAQTKENTVSWRLFDIYAVEIWSTIYLYNKGGSVHEKQKDNRQEKLQQI